MALLPDSTIELSGLDWAAQQRVVDIDRVLWQRLVSWKGSAELAEEWIQGQIQLFSGRHPSKAKLSHIISSIAFVELANSTLHEPGQGQAQGSPIAGKLSGLRAAHFNELADGAARAESTSRH